MTLNTPTSHPHLPSTLPPPSHFLPTSSEWSNDWSLLHGEGSPGSHGSPLRELAAVRTHRKRLPKWALLMNLLFKHHPHKLLFLGHAGPSICCAKQAYICLVHQWTFHVVVKFMSKSESILQVQQLCAWVDRISACEASFFRYLFSYHFIFMLAFSAWIWTFLRRDREIFKIISRLLILKSFQIKRKVIGTHNSLRLVPIHTCKTSSDS